MKTMTMWLVIGVALCGTACGRASAPAAGPQERLLPAEDEERDAEAAPATSYARAARALSENRMLSPAGDNAVEHYLAARTQAVEQARAQAALAELQPYVLIATEQAIARGDAKEAARLRALIERIDAQAPALPRLAADVAALARGHAARADAAVAVPEAAMPTPAAPARRLAASAPAPSAIAPVLTESVPAGVPSAAPVTVAQEAPPPAVAPRIAQGARAPRLLQDAQPRYPLPALRARIEGQVDVAFTVQPDGSVRDVRLLSSTPGGMFDASALAVAQRWRFEATGQAHASSRTVRFRLPAGEAGGG